ncbi:hypothetical protein AAG747_15140 [Rapidithrix thailandica]|uniref:DUF1648 domain-containing protein n=1 Tax=Rapidithrix thailandica TaxID=413964 RepID=A0AAW9RZN5_9BACT
MFRLAKYAMILTLLTVLGINLLCYIYFPQTLKLDLTSAGFKEYLIDRGSFFYSSIFIALLMNIGLSVIGISLPYLPKSLLILPNKTKWHSNSEMKKELYERAKGWIYALNSIINLFMIYCVAIVFSFNSDFEMTHYGYIVLFALLMVTWVAFYFYSFLSIPKKLLAE